LHNITGYCTPPRPILRCFSGVWRCLTVWSFFFCYLVVGFWMILDGWRCLKNSSRHGKGGIIAHYCAIPPSQPPFISYNIAQSISPMTPFIAIKYWQFAEISISCKGQVDSAPKPKHLEIFQGQGEGAPLIGFPPKSQSHFRISSSSLCVSCARVPFVLYKPSVNYSINQYIITRVVHIYIYIITQSQYAILYIYNNSSTSNSPHATPALSLLVSNTQHGGHNHNT